MTAKKSPPVKTTTKPVAKKPPVKSAVKPAVKTASKPLVKKPEVKKPVVKTPVKPVVKTTQSIPTNKSLLEGMSQALLANAAK